ncbi:PIN domain-containing protein [Siccirubricoccus phaeus]|uniref:hypothetical protein n=1 Tax=Siccirubricoccus phaeus TaxID=2595053 RepID=UPI00165A26A5|nr:hypothetical protein [Siccirubricoccus phaeus]
MYLLGTQALLDAASGSHAQLMQWLDGVSRGAIHLSVISFGRALHEVTQLAPSGDRSCYLQNLETLTAMVRDQGHLLAVDDRIGRTWAHLLSMDLKMTQPSGETVDLDDDNRIVVATALQRNLTLVEPAQPYQATLPKLAVHAY